MGVGLDEVVQGLKVDRLALRGADEGGFVLADDVVSKPGLEERGDGGLGRRGGDEVAEVAEGNPVARAEGGVGGVVWGWPGHGWNQGRRMLRATARPTLSEVWAVDVSKRSLAGPPVAGAMAAMMASMGVPSGLEASVVS